MATVLQICLILGVLLPLASFAVLVFFGQRFPAGAGLLHRAASGLRPRARHFESPEYEPPQYGPGEPLAGWIATAACALSCVLALVVLVIWAGDPETRGAWTRAAVDSAPIWLRLGSMPIEVGVRLDSLTVIVFFMVTFCATCIHVFSLGYMRGETGYTRFFAFLSLFCFSMLGLVIAANLMLTFVFWELVGVCSYFLIGHWFEKKSASNAAIKAFVVNRVGDFGFLFGLGLCIAFLGTLSLDQLPAVFEAGAHKAGWATGALSPAAEKVAEAVATRASQLFTTQLGGISLATLLGLGLFCGAIGKSAQFPLHVWLPDAMEGPTPVSALIHAATMVAAGVYMVARIYAVLTPGALFVISVIGCITLTMAALMAVVQTDIKRVLAYSTLSQLGYMVFGLGVGSWIGALFHLLTHAFFKALLFLGSGQVIAACHHEQDMRKMGGLAPKLKRTAGCFLIAVLAISGAGIPWTSIGLGGFYSKDEILVVAMARLHAYTGAGEAAGGWHVPTWLFALPVLIAWLTPLYMGRCFVMTFLGKPRDHHIYEHARESPMMYRPLLMLAFMTLISGIPILFFRSLVADAAPQAHALALTEVVNIRDPEVHHALHHEHTWMPILVGFAWVGGLGLAYWMYIGGLARAEAFRRLPGVTPVCRLLENKFYFDHIYGAVFVGGTKALAVIARLFDQYVIDFIADNLAYATERLARFSGWVLDLRGVDGAVNGVGDAFQGAGGAFHRVQTGRIRNYLLLGAGAIGAGIVGLVLGGSWQMTVVLVVVLGAVVAVPWGDLRRRLQS